MAFEGQGTRIYWSTSTSVSTSSTALVGQVTGFNGPSGSAGVIDITNLQSTAKEKLIGLRDEGNITLDVLYAPGSTNTGQGNLQVDRATRTRRAWVIDLNDASSSRMHGKGYCSGFSITGAVDDAVKASITIEIDGAVTNTTV